MYDISGTTLLCAKVFLGHESDTNVCIAQIHFLAVFAFALH